MHDVHDPAIQQQVTWVYTSDPEGTCEFYADVLGLVQVLDQGSCRIYRTGQDAFLGVCRARPGRRVEPEGVVITLVTDRVDDWYQRLGVRGAPLEAPPSLSEAFNVYSFFTRDPNGYRIEFQTFRDPAWPGTSG
jgi:catechol 2,3-dioxygenase-like lactoylglutathione lyase family enzyme